LKIKGGHPYRLLAAMLGSCIVLVATAAVAQAQTVTLGAPFGELERTTTCPLPGGCGIVATASPTASVATVSPIDGTVVGWSVEGATPVPGYNVTVLRKNADGTYSVTASSPLVTPTGAETQTFSVSLPIQAGEYVEENFPEGGGLGELKASNVTAAFFFPALALGETRIAGEGEELPPAFNVVIESIPPVTVIAPSPTSAPPTSTPTVEAPHCVVPKLNGKKLKAAKKKIKGADCRVGLVSKKNGVKVANGKVIKQSPKAGKVLPAHTGVSIKLG
jgi:hypothetical protein